LARVVEKTVLLEFSEEQLLEAIRAEAETITDKNI